MASPSPARPDAVAATPGPFAGYSKRRFRVANAPPALRAWIQSVHKGIEAYFPTPEVTTMAAEKRVLEWKSYDADRRRIEARWEPRFERILKISGKAVGEAYARQPRGPGAPLAAVDRVMTPALRDAMEACQLETEREFLKRLKMPKAKANDWGTLDPNDIPDMRSWNERTMASKITKVSEATKQAIREIIARGQNEGTAIFDVVERLMADYSFSRFRAYAIARTEVISASNAATHFGVGAMVNQANMLKDWYATGDKRTRPTHRKAGASQKDIPYDKPFQVGNSELMFPGDGSLGASAKEIVQCRCTTGYYIKPGAAPTPPPKPPTVPSSGPAPFGSGTPPSALPKPRPVQDLRKDLEKWASSDKAKKLSVQVSNAERQLAISRQESAREALEKAREALREDFLLNFGTNREAQKFNLTGYAKLPDVMKVQAKSAVDFLARLTPQFKKTRVMAVAEINSTGRAFAGTQAKPTGSFFRRSKVKDLVSLGMNDRADIWVHELGHILERQNLRLKHEAVKHLIARTKGEVLQSLRALTGHPGYEPTEMAWRDKWKHVYFGKDYNRYATEIVSMTLQEFYLNAQQMIEADPETAAIILRWLGGVHGNPIP